MTYGSSLQSDPLMCLLSLVQKNPQCIVQQCTIATNLILWYIDATKLDFSSLLNRIYTGKRTVLLASMQSDSMLIALSTL